MTPSVSQMSALETALILHSHGVACIPTDCNKVPTIGAWAPYQESLPTEDVLQGFFRSGGNIAVVAGQIQCIDIDSKHRFGLEDDYFVALKAFGCEELLSKVVVQETPTGGYHLIFRCKGELRNMKLAKTRPRKKEDGSIEAQTLIETRGKGGYFLIAPSAGYSLVHGDWSDIPELTVDERDALLEVARTFDEQGKEARQPALDETKPGDAYDAVAEFRIPALLEKHGWKPCGHDNRYWTRPGKKNGVSASWGVVPGRFWCFTTSSVFESEHVYRPWHVYALLEHGGDFAAAARELGRQGYGAPAKSPKEKARELARESAQVVGNTDHQGASGTGVTSSADLAEAAKKDKADLLAMLLEREFDGSAEPPPIRPVFKLGDAIICTPGNLTAITAQAKVGKSAFLAAMMAAAMYHPDSDADCLGVEGPNFENKAVLHFDTEQSPDDFWHTVDRSRKRAQVTDTPGWLHAFSIADLSARQARQAISLVGNHFAALHHGVFAILIDGIADLVANVNDAEECNALVAELHTLAIRLDCAIICVIHMNPGGEKVRGHLGSQLERKAETNLKLEKDGEVTVVWSEKQRRAPILKDSGPRFRWDNELKMHASVSVSQAALSSPKMLELHDLAVEAFGGNASMKYMDLVDAIMKARGCAIATAKRQASKMRSGGILKQGALGLLTINQDVE